MCTVCLCKTPLDSAGTQKNNNCSSTIQSHMNMKASCVMMIVLWHRKNVFWFWLSNFFFLIIEPQMNIYKIRAGYLMKFSSLKPQIQKYRHCTWRDIDWGEKMPFEVLLLEQGSFLQIKLGMYDMDFFNRQWSLIITCSCQHRQDNC